MSKREQQLANNSRSVMSQLISLFLSGPITQFSNYMFLFLVAIKSCLVV